VTTVAVTGATGFIGRHATAGLLARGFDVRAVLRPGSPHAVTDGSAIVHAPLDAAALRSAFGGASAVVHLAGVVTAVDERVFAAVNADGTRAAAEAAAAVGAHFVCISSLAAAGPAPLQAPRSEDDPPAPQTPYGRSKLAGEQSVSATPGLSWTILRPGVVYGPGDRAVFPFFKCAELGLLPLVGRLDAAYMFVHVDDVVRAIVAAVEARPAATIAFVGHPRPVTGRDVLEAARTAVGRAAIVVRIPQVVTHLASVVCDVATPIVGKPLPLNRWRYAELCAEGFVCRVDRLRERLGVVPAIDLREGFAQTAGWYRREGWLRP
jgi:nucleoside-diphosphate-sugar epimerase